MPTDLSGTWVNQRGSQMVLTVALDRTVTGTYHSVVGGPITGSVAGKVNGDQIVFFVDWTAGSMTTWAGQLLTTNAGDEVLETVWLHTGEIADANEPYAGWAGIRTGGDLFRRVP